MFSKLQTKWKVGGWQLVLIIATFAIGGSLTGWLGRKVLGLAAMEHNWLYYLLYILIITIIWPFMVLIISIPMGQFVFFKGYLRRLFQRISKSKQSSTKKVEKSSA